MCGRSSAVRCIRYIVTQNAHAASQLVCCLTDTQIAAFPTTPTWWVGEGYYSLQAHFTNKALQVVPRSVIPVLPYSPVSRPWPIPQMQFWQNPGALLLHDDWMAFQFTRLKSEGSRAQAESCMICSKSFILIDAMEVGPQPAICRFCPLS